PSAREPTASPPCSAGPTRCPGAAPATAATRSPPTPSSAAAPDRDRLLTVSDVAHQLGVPPHLVRTLDHEGALLPSERGPGNVGRLYTQALIDAVPEHQREGWRRRCAAPSDGLLSTGEVAPSSASTPATSATSPTLASSPLPT